LPTGKIVPQNMNMGERRPTPAKRKPVRKPMKGVSRAAAKFTTPKAEMMTRTASEKKAPLVPAHSASPSSRSETFKGAASMPS
jgi:hypothetical protein